MDGYDTVSEGIAYGMLFAAYMNDQSTFDGLWAYTQKHTNEHGFMHWRIAANGSVLGANGATDADEDMAAALIVADTTWGGYTHSAKAMIDRILKYEVEPGTYVLKPGDVWGGSSVTNPSYIAPAYYDLFQAYTGNNEWKKVKDANYTVLRASQNAATGLVPDWSMANGAAAQGMSYDFSYDAVRMPVRMAMAVAWNCDAAAKEVLSPFNQWFSGKNLTQLKSGYALNGTNAGAGDATPVVAAVASAASVSNNATYRDAAWQTLATMPATTYYPDSMKLFSMMVATGMMTNPIASIVTAPAPTVQPKTYTLTGSAVSGTVGVETEIRVNVSAGSSVSNQLIDVEVHDGNNKKVAQAVYENQSLSSTPKSYIVRWKPTIAGAYTVKAGVFTSDWSQALAWNDQVAPVNVTQPTAQPPLLPAPAPEVKQGTIQVWWPVAAQPVSGVQPFKAVLDGAEVGTYDLYWQVDGGRLNAMSSVYDAAPHKLSTVDLQGWNWAPSGQYTLNFVAKNKSGTVLGQQSVRMTVR
jgi:endo-1,4-beta-D-glucanase Y